MSKDINIIKGSSGPGKGWSKGKEYVPRTICTNCDSPFYCPPIQKRRGGGKYCSVRCMAEWRKKHRPGGVLAECLTCKALFRRPECRLKRNANNFCSKACVRKIGPGGVIKKPKTCPVCKVQFSGNTVRCSSKCWKEHLEISRPHNWKGGLPMKTCLACGKEYLMPRGNLGMACSMLCWRSIATKMTKGKPHPTGKGGKRTDLGNVYFRSSWEANWARYLNWLLEQGEICKWEFEPDTFAFHLIKRGTRFYTPDFKVFNKNGSIEYHEIKGWMTPESRTKLKRMAKYYPEIKVVLIDKKHYRSVADKMKRVIANWEINPKKSY